MINCSLKLKIPAVNEIIGERLWFILKQFIFYSGLVSGSFFLAYLFLFNDVAFTGIVMLVLVFASINWTFISLIFLVLMAITQIGLFSETLMIFRPFFLIAGASFLSWYFKFATKKQRHFAKSPQLLFILCLLCAETVSTIKLSWFAFTIETFMFWIKILIIFFLVSNLTDTIVRLRIIIWTTLISALFISLYALHTYFFEPNLMVAGRLAAYGVYDNANDLALLMVMTWPMGFKLLELEKSIPVKITLIIILIGISFTLLLTLSRGGMMGLMVVGLLCLWTSPNLTLKKKLIVIVPGIMIVLALLPLLLSQRGDESGFAAEDESAGHRLLAWEAGGRMLLTSPIGYGFSQFIEETGDFGGPPNLQAHNTQVKVAAESGWLGIISYLGMIFFTLKYLLTLESNLKIKAIYEPLLLIQALRISLIGFLINTSFSVKEHEWALYIVLGLGVAAREIYRNMVSVQGKATAW